MITAGFTTISNLYHQVTEFVSPLSSPISYIAKRVFLLGCFAAVVNDSPYFGLPIGFLIGLTFPEFIMEKTAKIYASIFSPQELKINNDDIMLEKIMKTFHSYKPAIVAGTIAFFALPVSFKILTNLVTLRFFAYIGMTADTDKYKDQWLYKEKRAIA